MDDSLTICRLGYSGSATSVFYNVSEAFSSRPSFHLYTVWLIVLRRVVLVLCTLKLQVAVFYQSCLSYFRLSHPSLPVPHESGTRHQLRTIHFLQCTTSYAVQHC